MCPATVPTAAPKKSKAFDGSVPIVKQIFAPNVFLETPISTIQPTQFTVISKRLIKQSKTLFPPKQSISIVQFYTLLLFLVETFLGHLNPINNFNFIYRDNFVVVESKPTNTLKGIFVGSKVKRGRDWSYCDEVLKFNHFQSSLLTYVKFQF